MAGLNDLPQTPQSPADYGAGPQGPTAGPPPLEPADREPNKDARMWGMFAHLAGFGGIVVPAIGSILGPLIVWLLKKDQYPFVDDQGKEALNFQITMFIYGLVSALLWLICIGALITLALAIVDIVFIIIATIKANDGIRYRYPKGLIFRFVK
jgi:uncharacterized Tic20 family protein